MNGVFDEFIGAKLVRVYSTPVVDGDVDKLTFSFDNGKSLHLNAVIDNNRKGLWPAIELLTASWHMIPVEESEEGAAIGPGTPDLMQLDGAGAVEDMTTKELVESSSEITEGIKISEKGVEDISTKKCTCGDIFVDPDIGRIGHEGPCRGSVVDMTTKELIESGPVVQHKSDCAVHNEPALPKGECDCQDRINEKKVDD